MIPAFVNKALAGRPADALRRRAAVTQVRLRRGSRRRRRLRPRRCRRQPRLQPRLRRVGHDQADRRDDPGADRRRRDRLHARPPRRLRRQDRLLAPGAGRARLDRRDAVLGRRAQVHRVAPRAGRRGAPATAARRGNGSHGARRSHKDSNGSGAGGELAPAGEPEQPTQGPNVLVISADIGEGHDLPARAVAREFRERDPDSQVSVVNGLPAMGRVLTAMLRGNSAFLFAYLPWVFDLQYRLCLRFAPTRWLALRLLTALGRRGLGRLIAAHDPDVIVSTYPGVTGVLGEMRRNGQAADPVLLVDHRSRRTAVLGPPRDRPALHHASRVSRGGRADRRPRQRALGQAADLARVRRAARAGRRAPRARAAGDRQADRDLRRRLGRRAI